MPSLITTYETELVSVNAAIAAWYATGALPVSYSIPTGHSVDTKDTLMMLYRIRAMLIEQINEQNPAYVPSVAG